MKYNHSLVRRPTILLLVLLSACSNSGLTTPTSSLSNEPTTTTGGTPQTTTADEGLSAPELPDPFDLAEEPLADLDIEGFDFDNVDNDLVEAVQVRISVFGGLTSASVFDELVADDGDEVIAVSLYPAGPARGDPGLALAIAEAIGDASPSFADPEERPLGGQTTYEVIEADTAWILWANNTHLFITAGDPGSASEVMEAIINETSGTEIQWSDGDCLYFDDGVPYAPFGDGNVVDCDGPHEWEITHSAPLPDAADAPFPDSELSERVGASCEEAFFDFVGALPLDSPLNHVVYLPDEDEWTEGDRYFACMISRNDERGAAKLTSGSLRGDAVVVTRTAGDCYRRLPSIGQVDCSDPHVFEYIGLVGHEADDYPGDDELTAAFEASCAELIEGYAVDQTVEGATVTALVLNMTSFAWDMGGRQVPCFAYAVEDGFSLEVVGSFSEGWGPLGDAGGAIQA